jgi:hypothetical protein
MTKSVLSASVVTQCAWSFSVCSRRPWSASHTRTVRSLDAVYKTPLSLPPQRTTLTEAEWPPSVYASCRVVLACQTRTVPSLDDEARRGVAAFLVGKPRQEM